MEPLTPANLTRFGRRFRFAGGRVRRVKLRYKNGRADIEVVASGRTAIIDLDDEPGPVLVRFRIADVGEFRFQKRPGFPGGKISDLRIAFLNDAVWINFDAWPLEPGERDGVPDFRASDAFASGGELFWEVVEKKE